MTSTAAPDPNEPYHYIGSELELFADAVRWKRYLSDQFRPWLGNRVVEVGAGLGGSTPWLCLQDHEEWLLLEPDPRLAALARDRIHAGQLPNCCRVTVGTTESLSPQTSDTFVYTDVLEHIEDDQKEFHRAGELLASGGHLIVLSPAHQSLFSEFDRAVGHCRRYDKAGLKRLTHSRLELVCLRYLDACGVLASLVNKLFLKQSVPTLRQIHFWDRRIVPCSRLVDPLTGYQIGKSILGVWRKT